MLTKALELAAQITHPIGAAAFAAVLALIALLALSRRKGKTPAIAWMLSAFIFLLGLMPLLSQTFLEGRGIYRVRIEVLAPDRHPVHNAAITSSAGGELKKTDAGWEFTVPPQSRPSDGSVTFRASEPTAYLSGESTLKLTRDYNPQVIVELTPLPAATLRGMVLDQHRRPVPDARVWIPGYDEAVTTGPTGSFTLPTHAADGQQVTVFVQKGTITAQTTAFAGKTAEIELRASR